MENNNHNTTTTTTTTTTTKENSDPDPGSNSNSNSVVLEITLISAQSLIPPPSLLHRRLHAYATLIPPFPSESPSSHALRTRTDQVGSINPTWNDKFLLRVPVSALSPSSSASLSVLIFADAGFLPLSHPLLGSVRLLLSNYHLHAGKPTAFSALGIRRPSSGRFHGVLNLALSILPQAPALFSGPALAYRDLLIGEGGPLKEYNHHHHHRLKEEGKGMARRNKKKKRGEEKDDGDKENQSRMHVGPGDQILNLQQIPWNLKERSV